MDGNDVLALERIIDNLQQAMEGLAEANALATDIFVQVASANTEAGKLLRKAQEEEAASYGIDAPDVDIPNTALLADEENAWKYLGDDQ